MLHKTPPSPGLLVGGHGRATDPLIWADMDDQTKAVIREIYDDTEDLEDPRDYMEGGLSQLEGLEGVEDLPLAGFEDGVNRLRFDQAAESESMEERSRLPVIQKVKSMFPVKSISEVTRMQEVRNILPIDDSVAMEAIRMWGLKNKLAMDSSEEGTEASLETDEIKDVVTKLESAEEVDGHSPVSELHNVMAQLKQEVELASVLNKKMYDENMKLKAMDTVLARHKKNIEALNEQKEMLMTMYNNPNDANEIVFESGPLLEKLPIESIKRISSLLPLHGLEEVRVSS